MDLDSDLLKQLETEEEELFPPLRLDQDFSTIVVVCGLPIVPREKEEKFKPLIRDILLKVSVESTQEAIVIKDLWMPFKDTPDESKGHIFVNLQKSSHAMAVKQKLNGSKFIGKYVFKVYRYEEWASLNEIPDEYVPLKDKPYVQPDALSSWLYSDESLDGKDQYVTRFDNTYEIYWRDNNSVTLESKKPLSDNLEWSPHGTYLVTYAPLGVVLLGGPSWQVQKAFKHPHVQAVQFSPCEKFLFTWSPKLSHSENPENPESIVLWDVKTGKKLRAFATIPEHGWPSFKWSFDDKYFSRIVKGLIYAYSTETLSLLPDETGQKKPIRLHGPSVDHAWSPTDPYLAVFIPEINNIPARVSLLSMPKRSVVSQQSFVNVIGCHIHWQEVAGNYLAIKVDRHGKSKKSTFTSFEFFRIRERAIPVEGLELKDNVIAFNWEPSGNRFAIIHGESISSSRFNVSFYSMEGGKLKLLKTLEKKQANSLFWAPTGRYIVLAGLRSMTNQLEFFDVDTFESLGTQQVQCTDVCWDPTGRFLASFVSCFRCKNENGFKIWTSRGVEFLSQNKDVFWQFMWRPRPPTLLSPEKLKWLELPKNFQEFQRKYKEKDAIEESVRSGRDASKREERRRAFRKWLQQRRTEWKSEAEWRRSLGIIDDDDEDFYIVEECVEEVISTNTVVLE
eukprot:TRINITY_DN10336_c0_g1_i1.p1 TRINITY_DN10336_c0_g1~~TRINITY_DN10336_c0_g1_i1.p1  ORF type:complete len:675 (-),score=151.95 TRINITY_DN10336_c0_g1_i1:18-2042(-)